MSLETLLFDQKRNDLENFVREQIVGPGGFNKRFFLLNEWEKSEFQGKLLCSCSALDNVSELIGEVPAYQYSSGIVFPIAEQTENSDLDKLNEIEEEHIEGDNEEFISELPKSDDEEFSDDHFESTSSKNQTYPNTIGLAFAVREGVVVHDDLTLSIKFRTYRKISQFDLRKNLLAYWVQFHAAQVSTVIDKYFSSVFTNEERDGNHFVLVKNDIDINQYLYALDYVNLNTFLIDSIIPKIHDLFGENSGLYKKESKEFGGTRFEFTILYDDKLHDLITNGIYKSNDHKDKYVALANELEVLFLVRDLINTFKSIYKRSSQRNKAMPIWQSKGNTLLIKLPNCNPNLKIQRGEEKVTGFEDLLLSYQYMRDGKGLLYIKIVLVNKSRIKINRNEPPQLNKKDLANKLSYFGVELKILEEKFDVLQAYNPPNLLEIDEEDNFNKLIYRNFKDYGEGYNSSVSWGLKGDEPMRYVQTEFLPQEETPDVDFKPSTIVDGKIVSRIDGDLLDIFSLSTLSKLEDLAVLNRLQDLVNAYLNWIHEKEIILDTDNSIEHGKELLYRQLLSCRKDYDRLKRNIQLLKNSNEALTAFRLMNTAMFMQLHHGIEIKSLKKNHLTPFLPTSNSESYYKNIGTSKRYSWRSFQLAFILLNIDGFVQPNIGDKTVEDVFGTGWPERNEIADLVWFPTGGGKTEAYLGIIAFSIIYRRFTQGQKGFGTAVLMRYTLRLLTLQQFQRATLLICALEAIRKDNFKIPHQFELGRERITIGLFVGGKSSPNSWEEMQSELKNIADQIGGNYKEPKKIKTNLPHTECPWCGGQLFVDSDLSNISPSHSDTYNTKDRLTIMCNSQGCTFAGLPDQTQSLPFALFDRDVYKFPPTLLFGTVDKFAAIAHKISTRSSNIDQDARRIFGKGYKLDQTPPELIIQDELHLLSGPLGSAVGLFEKSIDILCTYKNIKPKIITSTATTRNTDKQIFALFDRRSEIFPKQGILCDDSFFAYYKRKENQVECYDSKRKYIGLLPVGKTQVWLQLRLAAIALVHRIKYVKEKFSISDLLYSSQEIAQHDKVLDYYHTVLSYFNSLKEVGKTESQLNHYLPGDVNLVIKNTMTWSFFDRLIRSDDHINYSELTGRLSGEEVKTNLSSIETAWRIPKRNEPPEFVIATNMISVGIDVSRFNIMIINSMPRNTAEYIQASSRVARDTVGIVFTVHHPYRSRDISHFQRFKEFHEKFYSYVEPISITPFATKALERYYAMFLAVLIRHKSEFGLSNNDSASTIDRVKLETIKNDVNENFNQIYVRAQKLNTYLGNRNSGLKININGIIGDEELLDLNNKTADLLFNRWLDRIFGQEPILDLEYRNNRIPDLSLFKPRSMSNNNIYWNVKESLREIAPTIVIKTVQQ